MRFEGCDDAIQTTVLTLLAMVAFAANSLLCRLALGEGHIDAASFTTVRMASGALTLLLIVLPQWRRNGRAPADWRSVAMLFAYMACFSFAYLSLSVGTGALLLFGAVQLSVPVLAAVGGVLLLAEPVTPRLLLSSAATLGGIAIVLAQKARLRKR